MIRSSFLPTLTRHRFDRRADAGEGVRVHGFPVRLRRSLSIPALAAVIVAMAVVTPSTTRASPPSPRDAAQKNWVVAENLRAGTSRWRISPSAKRDIDGFADKVSAQDGSRVTLYVDTSADRFRVFAYRMGWYHGLGGRLVWKSHDVAGRNQSRPSVEPVTNMVETSWRPSVTVHIGSWPEGTYLFKLVSNENDQSYVPFVIRDDRSRGHLMLQQQVATWQAYNTWGGYSLYRGPDGGFASRSRVVSFDRPYGGRGAAGLLNSLAFVVLAERAGLDVTYSTDLDLHTRPELLTRHRALISLDHDEYWSTAMRDGATAARADGVNFAVFGANAIYRHIRIEASPLGTHRRMVAYKRASEDPLFGVDNDEVTVNWRSPPLHDPESELLGAMYECNPVHADMVVADAQSWVFAGTGMSDGDHIPGAVDMEYDRIFPDAPTPASIQVLAHSSLRCRDKARAADMTYYTARSGAGVFDAASQGWVKKIRCFDPVRSDTCDQRAVRITLNVLRAVGAGPAGNAHPSVPNASSFGYVLTDPTDP